MKLFPISDPFKGEKLADVIPVPAPFVDAPSRLAYLNFVPGRNLTPEVLIREQAARLWPIERRGTAVTPGVVEGLEVGLLANSKLQISPGRALSGIGVDVVIDRTVEVRCGDLRVFDPKTPALSDFLSQNKVASSVETIAVLALLPGWVEDEELPVGAQVTGNESGFSPCSRMPEDRAFYRETTIDSWAVVLYAWPKAPAFSGATWRNRVAWEIFSNERTGGALPWVGTPGVPLAVVALDANRRPLWLDRYSVVRAGGHPRRRQFVPKTGDHWLWQAQFDQLSNQLSDLASLDPATTNFATLPPVGVLPKALLTMARTNAILSAWTITQRFFPPTYVLDIAVAPLEQLDSLIDDARSLEPYRLTQPDSVRLLLPVSQRWFDPDLLKIDVPAPEFTTTITKLKARRGDKLASRLDLRNRMSALNNSVTGAQLLFPNPDPKQLETPEKPISNLPLPLIQFGTKRSPDSINSPPGYVIDVYNKFIEDAKNALGRFKFTTAEENELTTLRTKLTGSDLDKINSFIHEQKALQNEEETQLASLVLGSFISYLETKTDAADRLLDNGFLKVRTDVYRLGQLLTNNSLTTKFAVSPSLANIVERNVGMADSASVNSYASQLLGNMAPSAQAIVPSMPSVALQEAKTPVGKAALPPFVGGQLAPSVSNSGYWLIPNDVRKIPIDRLQPALAPQVHEDLYNGKLEIFDKFAQLEILLGNLTTDFIDFDTPADPTTNLVRFSFQRLITLTMPDPLNQMDAGGGDESRHFSFAVKNSDMSIAVLRAVEKRIAEYRALIASARKALAEAQGFQVQARTALNQTDEELDEARHDVAVAEALLKEEQLRLDAVNARRVQILQSHVQFVVYHRPRAVSFRQDAPVREINSVLASDPVPDCLKEDIDLPPDLAALRLAFRGSPAKWFKHAQKWLQTIDRLAPIRETLERVVSHATTYSNFIDVMPAPSSGRYSDAIGQSLTNRAQQSQSYFAQINLINVSLLPTMSWIDLQNEALGKFVLAHLIDSAPATVATVAAQELTDIFKVGACLHRAFSGVPAVVRLIWAERFSQSTGPADFRDLSRLPRWDQIEFTLRREMQIDTDWLFSRIDATQSGAVDLINELIRVCLLLASHAPVDQLITGSVVESVTPTIGGILKLTIDPSRVRVGMDFVLDSAEIGLLKARVEDISSGQARARFTTAPEVATTLAANTSMRLE